ncbi:MAG: hypothetical protein KatS3mg031_2613 [Chitinophagales bacterium]|nr:MAG: hypothetical protein KatS3mg031_2613 [Chitinophagales bacterium]
MSRIELLTILSFIAQGHTFRLWVYDRIATPLPSHGLQLADATSIIPAAEVFSYRKANKYGHGKGSYGGFSDIFRYKLLYEHGGWWVDMDVTCLKPLNFPEPYFFRPHHELPMVGNVMKCPKGSALMLACYEQAKKEVTEENTDWHKPIEILNHYVFHYQLQEYIFNPISNEDKWSDLKKLISRDVPVPAHYFVIHWMNEEWRSRKIDKNDVRYGGVLGKLMQQYGLLEVPSSRWRLFTHNFRHSVWIPVYENLLKT